MQGSCSEWQDRSLQEPINQWKSIDSFSAIGNAKARTGALGAVGEIVTGLRQRFERQGRVRTGRERVDILDTAARRTLAARPR